MNDMSFRALVAELNFRDRTLRKALDKIAQDAEFKESDHPRKGTGAGGGQFTSGGGGGGSAPAPKAKTRTPQVSAPAGSAPLGLKGQATPGKTGQISAGFKGGTPGEAGQIAATGEGRSAPAGGPVAPGSRTTAARLQSHEAVQQERERMGVGRTSGEFQDPEFQKMWDKAEKKHAANEAKRKPGGLSENDFHIGKMPDGSAALWSKGSDQPEIFGSKKEAQAAIKSKIAESEQAGGGTLTPGLIKSGAGQPGSLNTELSPEVRDALRQREQSGIAGKKPLGLSPYAEPSAEQKAAIADAVATPPAERSKEQKAMVAEAIAAAGLSDPGGPLPPGSAPPGQEAVQAILEPHVKKPETDEQVEGEPDENDAELDALTEKHKGDPAQLMAALRQHPKGHELIQKQRERSGAGRTSGAPSKGAKSEEEPFDIVKYLSSGYGEEGKKARAAHNALAPKKGAK